MKKKILGILVCILLIPSVLSVTVTANEPPYQPLITGPARGKADKEYEYTFSSVDPDGDNLEYYIDWGDGQAEEWIGPYPSGHEVKVKHTWAEQGTYTIEARTRDTEGLQSPLNKLTVSLPKNKQSINTLFMQFLERIIQRFPLLERIFSLFPVLNGILNI